MSVQIKSHDRDNDKTDVKYRISDTIYRGYVFFVPGYSAFYNGRSFDPYRNKHGDKQYCCADTPH